MPSKHLPCVRFPVGATCLILLVRLCFRRRKRAQMPTSLSEAMNINNITLYYQRTDSIVSFGWNVSSGGYHYNFPIQYFDVMYEGHMYTTFIVLGLKSQYNNLWLILSLYFGDTHNPDQCQPLKQSYPIWNMVMISLLNPIEVTSWLLP